MTEKCTLTREQLMTLLDLKAAAVRRGIDASACGTARDHQKARDAENALYDALDEAFGEKGI